MDVTECLLAGSAVLMLLLTSSAPQTARTEATPSGQLLFNNACRTCHTTNKGDNRLVPIYTRLSAGKLVRCQTIAIQAR
jgi:cytochrome c2